MAKTAEIRDINPDLLRPYERNAKIHGEEQLKKLEDSILEFGFLTPCLIDRDYNIIAGHGRVLAAKRLGMRSVPCVFIEGLTETQRRAYILADNRLGELGEWDMSIVDDELHDLADMDFDATVTGFDFEEDPDEITEDEYTESTEETPTASRGDVYQLGRHRLMCGDATDHDDVKTLMCGNVADIAITSPPYGASKSAKIRTHYVPGESGMNSFYIEHDDDIEDWYSLINNSFENMVGVTSCQYINIQMLADNKRLVVEFLHEHMDALVDVIVWDKVKAPPQMQSGVLNNQFEFVFVFAGGGASRTIPFAKFHGNMNNVIKLTVGYNEFSDVHKAVFPVGFPSAIMNISSGAETVLDLFGGTGTTLIAAEQTGRTCYMMELDPHYVDVIINRWEQFTGEKAVRVG